MTKGTNDPPVTPRVVDDLPARALLDESIGADLTVVGGRGTRGFPQVAHHATGPVVVVPPRRP